MSISYLIGQSEKLNKLTGSIVPLWDLECFSMTNLPGSNEKFQKRENENFIQTNCSVSEQAFALRMQGNSMLPLFSEGAILIFESKELLQQFNHTDLLMIYYCVNKKTQKEDKDWMMNNKLIKLGKLYVINGKQ